MYKIVLLDLDDTIFDFKSGERNALKETFNNFNLDFTDDAYNEFSKLNEYYFQEYAKGNMTREEFHFNRFDKILKYLMVENNPVIINKYYMDSLSMQCEYVPGAYELILELSKNYILCIASNGKYDVQVNRLKKANIFELFDKVYVSSKIGYNKPSKEFFDYIFNDYKNYNKNEFVIIGDRLDSDILGGINSGIDTIWFNRNNKVSDIKPKYSFKTLDEIRQKMAK